MSTFTVDPPSVRQLAGRLGQLCAEMQGMQNVAAGYDGLLGGQALDGEIQSFCGNWDYGVGLLQQHMQHVVQNLGKAAAMYASSEQDIADAARV